VILTNLITEKEHAATVSREATLKIEAAVSPQTLVSEKEH
jgi:hypothetical protein